MIFIPKNTFISFFLLFKILFKKNIQLNLESKKNVCWEWRNRIIFNLEARLGSGHSSSQLRLSQAQTGWKLRQTWIPDQKSCEKIWKTWKKWQLHPLRLPPTLCTTNNPNTNRIGILTMKTGHLCLSWKILTKRTSKWPKLRPLILSLVKVGTNRLDHHPHAHPDPRVFTSLWKCRPPIHCHPMLS